MGRRVALCLLMSGLLCCERSHGSPEALAGIVFVDQDSQTIRPTFLAGEVLVLNFMFTSCPSVCPRLTQLLADARTRLPDPVRQRVRFLSVSVDPENDVPPNLKAFAERMRADEPTWRFARVDESALAELSKRLVVFEPGATPTPSAHNSNLFLFDRAGRLVQRYSGSSTEPQRLAREITALDALGHSNAQRDQPDGDAAPARVGRLEGSLRR